MATRVMRRPIIWGGAAVLVIVVLASPFLHVAFTGADASALPSSSSAGATYAWSRPGSRPSPRRQLGVVVDSSQVTPAELATYSTSVAHVAGVKAVPAFQHLAGRSGVERCPDRRTPVAHRQQAVEAIQALPGPGHVTVIGSPPPSSASSTA